MRFRIELLCDGDAFADDNRAVEVARLMRVVAYEVHNEGRRANTLRDLYGNTCGNYGFELDA